MSHIFSKFRMGWNPPPLWIHACLELGRIKTGGWLMTKHEESVHQSQRILLLLIQRESTRQKSERKFRSTSIIIYEPLHYTGASVLYRQIELKTHIYICVRTFIHVDTNFNIDVHNSEKMSVLLNYEIVITKSINVF